LHVPSFRKDYEALWVSPNEPNTTFLVLLKLVFAIGAVTYDEKFSLRTSALQWVYEGQLWISEPNFKARLSIQALQINLLLLRAREVVAVGGESIWIAAGSLLRTAVYMGLHRDPGRLPKRTSLASEIRRRLWNSVIELSLQASLILGTPSMISLDDFDTEPPHNFDDDQLVADDAMPKPEDHFTQASVAIALRKAFPIRLEIVNFLNAVGPQGTYEEALRLDASLRAVYQDIRRSLHGSSHGAGQLPARFDIRVMDFIMNRYLSSLHIPFFGPSLHEAAYAFSRKVVVETSIKLWCAAYPASPIVSPQSNSQATTVSGGDDLARLAVCGYGLIRLAALQASCLLLLELRTQLQEDNSLGPVPLRRDLLSVVDDTKNWQWQCIESGETNVKGYMLTALVTAQIDAIMQGFGRTDMAKKMVKAIEAAEDKCLAVLEERASEGQTEGSVADFSQMSLNASIGLVEDWDFLVSKRPPWTCT
jgi:hypothetical protein